ncbi:hypothetical protein J4E83_007002 [Alternaria metachromatica]|uniref:uncharacterized protein n=1 Tax=Alternaria metachromatica TaxID=283354 RepID=UPI0020C3694F|nr:uncharacterized protein J4E83_007002 [Alternaria metachromatica]KAI4615275.1 hypothetical protein J4E83_007002 [Alternaria metachromatica]
MFKHGNIHYFKTDVTSKSDLSAAVDHIAAKSGYVNLVVANSGIQGPTLKGLEKGASITEFRDHLWNWGMDEFTQTFAVNTTSTFFTVVAFLELLDKGNKAGNIEQKSQVICISSAGAFNRVPMAGYAYAGSKSAAVHIMKALATTLVPYDIRSNVLAPGCKSKHLLPHASFAHQRPTVYPSEMTAGMLNQETWPRDFIPDQRAGNIKDMAGAILFLTSRAGGYVNGNVLLTDGGRLSILPATY